MKVKVYKLSSFAKAGSGGNPAAVVLDAQKLTEAQMKSLADKIGFSETAFVSQSEHADYKVRFFTPNSEIDLCGHATIAAFSLLKQKNIIGFGGCTQETKAGILEINISETGVFMEQTHPEFGETIPFKELEACLGLKGSDFDNRMPAQIVSTGVRDILVPVRDITVLEALRPNMKKIEELSAKYNVAGLHVFAVSNTSDCAADCRNFAPLYGIPEESATGTSNGALACYLYKHGFLNGQIDDITIEQGAFMGKPSMIKAILKVDNNEIKEVWIGGEAFIIGDDDYQI